MLTPLTPEEQQVLTAWQCYQERLRREREEWEQKSAEAAAMTRRRIAAAQLENWMPYGLEHRRVLTIEEMYQIVGDRREHSEWFKDAEPPEFAS